MSSETFNRDRTWCIVQIAQVYSGWVVWVYTDPRGQGRVLCPLLRRYHNLLYICDVTNLPPPLGSLTHIHHMMWRVAPLGDPQVAALMVRDTDSQVGSWCCMCLPHILYSRHKKMVTEEDASV